MSECLVSILGVVKRDKIAARSIPVWTRTSHSLCGPGGPEINKESELGATPKTRSGKVLVRDKVQGAGRPGACLLSILLASFAVWRMIF